jgi:hypothetical protein
MPTTIEVVHYYFDDQIVFCGYPIQSLNRERYFTKDANKVDCLKCLNLLKKATMGRLIQRANKPRYFKRHLRLGDSPVRGRFKAECGLSIEKDNLNAPEGTKLCRRCVQNAKSRGVRV